MKSVVWSLALALACVSARAYAEDKPAWAFLPIEDATRTALDDTKQLHIEGSTKSFTEKQIHSAAQAADWFPEQHPLMPRIIEFGHPPDVRTCTLCHGIMGMGNPESVDLAGLSPEYMTQQVRAFKDDERPLDPNGMEFARTIGDEDLKEAVAWYGNLKRQSPVRVTEADTVPKTVIKGGHIRLRAPGGGNEALGRRIVVLADNEGLLHLHDPRVMFDAYVPKGSVEAGKKLVTTGGGKTFPCVACHGADLHGQGDAPFITGRSPLYVARQLFNFRSGARRDANAALMQPVVAKFDDDDILNIAAYLSSVN